MGLLRAVLYCRYSTEEESQVDALRNQVLESEACVKVQGCFLVDKYVESKSGTTTRGRVEYSRELSKKINNGHRHCQINGGKVMLTSRVFGFEKLPGGTVSIIEEEADVIRKIFEYCAAGYGSRPVFWK